MKGSQLLKSCFLLVFLVWKASSQSQTNTVLTSSGFILGKKVNIDDHRVYQYLGIPYARPPVGDLRFKRPLPVQPWLNTLIADKMPPACIQYSESPFPWYDFQSNKSENCLYLNIWVPADAKANRAVMFWIHGGGFAVGSNRLSDYDGRALAAEGDVIVVTINYRLGAFGFFTTNTDTAPVNNAMYDMLAALKWVNRNIYAFGGDPKQVTIFGESAGSLAVGLLCMSPLTKGLFKRAILQSASPASPLVGENTAKLELGQKIAEDLICADPMIDIDNAPDEVVNCMRKKDAFEIAKTVNSFEPHLGINFFPTYPNEFLPDNVKEALKTGNFHDVSILIGNTRDEGSAFLTGTNPELFGFFGEKLHAFNISTGEKVIKDVFKLLFNDNPGTDEVIKTIVEKFDEDDYRKNLKMIHDVFGDLLVLCPDVYFAESFSRRGKDVYFYFFTHRPSITPWANWMGVTHYEEVQFVFGSPLKEKGFTEEEVEFSKYVIKIWSNFAKYGDPFYDDSKNSDPHNSSPIFDKWPKYSREAPYYLVLNESTRNTKTYGMGPDKANCDLFRKLFEFP